MWCTPAMLQENVKKDKGGHVVRALAFFAGDNSVYEKALSRIREALIQVSALAPEAEIAYFEWLATRTKAGKSTNHVCRGHMSSDSWKPCTFHTKHPGEPCEGDFDGHCLLCSPDQVPRHVQEAPLRARLVQHMKTLLQREETHPEIVSAATQRLAVLVPAELQADVLKKARKQRKTVSEHWEEVLKHRVRALAPADDAATAEYQERKDMDLSYVRNRFFPKETNKRRDEHPAWGDVPEAASAEDLAELLSRECPNVPQDETGLPYAHVHKDAAFFQQWCRQGSWAMCAKCHRIVHQKLQPRKSVSPAEVKACRHCKSQIGYPVSQPADVPKALRHLTIDIIEALRPVCPDPGKYERARDGYRVHTGMTTFWWSAESVEDNIRALDSHAERKKAKRAFKYLRDCEDSAYPKFLQEHAAFLATWDRSDDDKRKRPLTFIERVGVECACWPHLYWTTQMCETAVRAADIRRVERRRQQAQQRAGSDDSSSESGAGDDDRDPDARRQSLKASFLAKLSGPLIGYAEDYALFQFIYDLYMWTTLGSKKNAVGDLPMRVLTKGSPFTPGFWRLRHAALLDCQRQLGFPDVFFTIAPYEWSFPYHQWIQDELQKCFRTRLHLPTAEALHIAHVFTELIRNWLTGAKNARWKTQLLKGEDGGRIVESYFARLEFQDGKRKQGTQQYHGSGRAHLHVLLWLQPGEKQRLLEITSATVSETQGVVEKALALGSQPSRGTSAWPVHTSESAFDDTTDKVRLHHTSHDFGAGLRAYFPVVLEALRCHQDVQLVHGRGLLMKYVAKYVPKFSDSFSNEWLSDESSDYALARKILFDYHPLEPEMILQMAMQHFKASFTSGTMFPIVTPYPGMAKKPGYVERYEECTWRGEAMTLLEYLRKANVQGGVEKYIRDARKKALPEDKDISEEAFARQFTPRGQKLVAAECYWRMNDRFYGQWLALHVPFRKLEELHLDAVREKVPSEHYYLALALQHRPDFWRDLDKVREDMEIEAVGTKPIETILNMIRANTMLIDSYMAGHVREGRAENAPDTSDTSASDADAQAERQGRRVRKVPEGMQIVLEDQIMKNVDLAIAIETCRSEEEAEELRLEREEKAKPIAALGPPGTGKSFILKRCIRKTLQRGGKVLLAVPTGQLQSRLREELKGLSLDVDTCHGAFLLHRPEQESLPLMTGYALVVVDEFPQLSRDDFDRVLRIWMAAGKVAALVLAGDFFQLPGVSGTGPKDSRYWGRQHIHDIPLHKSWRSDDDALLSKLKKLRVSVPKRRLRQRILRGRKAWSGHHKPTAMDLKSVLEKHPDTTVVTCTRRGAAHVNEHLAMALRGKRKVLAEIDGDFDANAANYGQNGKLLPKRRPVPAKLRVFKGLRVHLTRNLDKKGDFVNGMEATVLSFSHEKQTLMVRTKTGKRVAVYLYSDPDPAHNNPLPFFPVRYGYASTIYKMQGAQLPHVTIWLDRPGMRAAAYVAMSRVQKDTDYLFGGVCKKKHFIPNN